MKYIVALILFVLLSVKVEAQKVFSLQQAIDYALEHAPDVQKSDVARKISEAKLQQAYSKYLPKVSATADLRNNFQRGTIILPIARDPGSISQPTALKQGTAWNATMAVEATQNIYDPSATGDKKIALATINYSKAQLNEARIAKKVNVTKAYYAALLSFEKLALAKADTAQKGLVLKNATERYLLGRALKSERDKAYIQKNNSSILLQKAEEQHSTDMIFLSYQMGLAEFSSITLSDQLALPKEITSKPATAESRADYKTESENKNASLLNLQKIKKQYLPTVQLYGYLGTQAFRPEFNFLNASQSWYSIGYAGLKVSLPIFDGFEKKYQIQQQNLAMQQSDFQLQTIKNQAAFEIHEAEAKMDNARRTLTLQKENKELAISLFEQAKARIAEGKSLDQDLLDAQYTISETSQLYLQAIYDYLTAVLDYEKAAGVIVP